MNAQNPALCGAGLKSRFLGNDNRECTVEELALQHYATTEGGGWQGEASIHAHPCSAAVAAFPISLRLCDMIHPECSLAICPAAQARTRRAASGRRCSGCSCGISCSQTCLRWLSTLRRQQEALILAIFPDQVHLLRYSMHSVRWLGAGVPDALPDGAAGPGR